MATSAKNFSLSPAGQDLGLGDMVKQQLEDQENERKKKLAQMSSARGTSGGASQSLLGQGLGI